MKFSFAVLLVLSTLVPSSASARSLAERNAFARSVTCPSTGTRTTRCPGYVVDHIVPLCAGGADKRTNMRWQAIAQSQRKDADERWLCRALRTWPSCGERVSDNSYLTRWCEQFGTQ